jgi:hypothetical protein
MKIFNIEQKDIGINFSKGKKNMYYFDCPNKKCFNTFDDEYSHKRMCNICRQRVIIPVTIETEIDASYCPFCDDFFEISDIFDDEYEDQKTLWLANMVHHYKLKHNPEYIHGIYSGCLKDHYLRKVTMTDKWEEGSKQQVLLKCTDFLIQNGIRLEHFMNLKGTNKETVQLCRKLLNG